MANVAEKEVSMTEAIAHVSAFMQKWEGRVGLLGDFLNDLKGLRYDVVTLRNQREALERQNKDALIELEKVKREAATRLQSIEMGNRALVERLTSKEIELDRIKSECAKREAKADQARLDYEMAKSALDQKMAAVSEVAPRKAK